MKKKIKKCSHNNKKNISSNKISEDISFILVKCINCGEERYETRNKKTGSVETSKWYLPKL